MILTLSSDNPTSREKVREVGGRRWSTRSRKECGEVQDKQRTQRPTLT